MARECGIGASLDWGGCRKPEGHADRPHDPNPHGCTVVGCDKPEHRCTLDGCYHQRPSFRAGCYMLGCPSASLPDSIGCERHRPTDEE